MSEKIETPKSTHAPLSSRETVSAPPQEGNVTDAQPIGAGEVEGIEPTNGGRVRGPGSSTPPYVASFVNSDGSINPGVE